MEAGNTKSDTVVLLDGGEGRYMGDGVWALIQRDERGTAHSVVVARADLEALIAAC
jgi:hypothetical protein